MTNKTTMPDPMVEVDKHIVSSELQYTYLAPCGGLEHGTELITTEQAEAYANAMVKQVLEALNNQAQELYESSLNSRCARDGAADEDELKAIDLWNADAVGMAKAYTTMQKAIRALIPKEDA